MFEVDPYVVVNINEAGNKLTVKKKDKAELVQHPDALKKYHGGIETNDKETEDLSTEIHGSAEEDRYADKDYDITPFECCIPEEENQRNERSQRDRQLNASTWPFHNRFPIVCFFAITVNSLFFCSFILSIFTVIAILLFISQPCHQPSHKLILVQHV